VISQQRAARERLASCGHRKLAHPTVATSGNTTPTFFGHEASGQPRKNAGCIFKICPSVIEAHGVTVGTMRQKTIPVQLNPWIDCPQCGRIEKLYRDSRLPQDIAGPTVAFTSPALA